MCARRTTPYPAHTGSASQGISSISWPALSRADAARLHASWHAGSAPASVKPTSARFLGAAPSGVVAVMTENMYRASATVRVIGPRDWSTVASTSSEGTRSGVGRNPTTPQHDAGMRMDPPVSPPRATVQSPAATAAPLPPLEPPGVMPSRHGFCVEPKIAFVVPIDAASSGTFVFPSTAIPAARARATGTASTSAMRSRHDAVPYVYGMPATGWLSLTASV